MRYPSKLISTIKTREAILFVGAGISMTLGLPSWEMLISEIGKKLNYDPSIFKLLGDYLALAEYYKLEKGNIRRLKDWLSKKCHEAEDKIKSSSIHKLIVELDFPIIYTTNYDPFLEKAFKHHGKSYTKIVHVKDFAKIRADTTQIVKFHGDLSDENSIVLTESSYFERLDFESPLDIKLRADVLGKTILFIGYSLRDINIRYLFHKLTKLWRAAGGAEGRPTSYVFLSRPNPVQDRVLRSHSINPIFSELDSPQRGLEKFLMDLYRKVRD